MLDGAIPAEVREEMFHVATRDYLRSVEALKRTVRWRDGVLERVPDSVADVHDDFGEVVDRG